MAPDTFDVASNNPDSLRIISILRQLPVPQRVLDLGCGDGRDIAAYCQSGWRNDTLIVGLDLNISALRTAARRDIQVVQADIMQFPLRGRFDLILLRHPDVDLHKDAWEYAIRQLPYWLTDHGAALITTYSVPEMDTLRGWLTAASLTTFWLDTASLHAPGLSGRDRFVTAVFAE